MATDPICGMEVDPDEARSDGLVARDNGEAYFFCSSGCRDEFTGEMAWYKTDRFAAVFPSVLAAVLIGGAGTAIYLDRMTGYMGLFFIVFSVAKMPDWDGFVTAFKEYDILAGAVPYYAQVYPGLEFLLGVAYLAGAYLDLVAAVTVVVMGIGAIGVARRVLSDPDLQCACLGTWMNLPLTKVTLVEDLLMAGMAAMLLL